MAVNWTAKIGIATILLVAAFWSGTEFQKALYADQCLDLGGGQNPGQHSICIVETTTMALRLGPIGVTRKDVVDLEVRDELGDQALVYLKLRTEIASAITAFIAASIGQNLDIWINGQLVNSVRIAENVSGEQFILALTAPHAKKLERLLVANAE